MSPGTRLTPSRIRLSLSSIARSIMARMPTETTDAWAWKPVDHPVLSRLLHGVRVGLERRGVNGRDQVPGQGDAQDLADRVGGDHPADAEPLGHLEGQGRLAAAGGAPEQQDHRLLGLLVAAPDEVALGGLLAEAVQQGFVGEPAQHTPGDLMAAAPQQRLLDLLGHVEGVVGVDGRRQQRLGEGALREGSGGATIVRDQDATGMRRQRRLVLAQGLVAQDLADDLRELLALDHAPADDALADVLGGLEGRLEVDSPRHQRVHHDAAHEGTSTGGVLHGHPALVGRSPLLLLSS